MIILGELLKKCKKTKKKLFKLLLISSVGNALMSLFQLLTLDQWDLINRDLRRITQAVWSQIYIISWVWLGAFIFRGIFVGVIIQNFDRISDSIKEQKMAEMKQIKFNKLRQKLNMELNLQNHIQKSM